MRVPQTLNRHFLLPRSVKKYYTGRAKELAKLKVAFSQSNSPSQKTFVIFGLGGSGKTEFAIKFAEDTRQNYWGVFFIDGSSRENAFASYVEIAKVGGVEPNENAAKNWLTTRALPWLLVVDNVDADELQLESLLPAGSKGSILVTSRNPAHKSYGTAGDGYLELLPMEKQEADQLILKAAKEPTPWPKTVVDAAGGICKALGFLPLALVGAATAILSGVCGWGDYLGYYNRENERIRRGRLRRRSESSSRSSSSSGTRHNLDKHARDLNVFSTYEILYQSLASSDEQDFQDAVELLQVISYFHFQNIRLDVFIYAATNTIKETEDLNKQAQEEEKLKKRLSLMKRKSWSDWITELAIRYARYFDTPPALPSALKNPYKLTVTKLEEEVRDRTRAALAILESRSLVNNLDRLEGRYSMHPLIHQWIRERPDLSTAQQALWCQVALTVISRSITIPPLGDTEKERDMRRDLLPHLMHARSCQELVRSKLEDNSSGQTRLWPLLQSAFGRREALEMVRFSRVFSECGMFKAALELQTKVQTFAVGYLGEEHPLSIKITLAVTGTLWELSETSEATRLQRKLYGICTTSLGENDPMTLTITDLLASGLCFHGRWSESLRLHQRAVEGMTKVYGRENENTLKALNNLGRIFLRYMDFKTASEHHREAWEGLKKGLGESHFETLICQEDYAMALMRLGESHYQECHEMMEFVRDQRKKSLGEEQPYTLLAICNLGRVTSAMGQHSKAAQMMEEAIPIAERNLGVDHFGVLSGKMHYAQVLVHLRRFDEAEAIFTRVVAKGQYRKSTDEDGEHPDRIIALWYLTGCLQKQSKFQKALDICEELMLSLKEIGGQGKGTQHPFAALLQEQISTLQSKLKGTADDTGSTTYIPGEL
jgi:tetratricopeptide (TPR) repeat protein